ncbi:hypothetical protein CHS0354_015750 [Potamilus streckersoni]|uniref:DDB1-and CUL4-associated factor 5 n=1 Tax=Potamilus streckersoni TaxID=2493646 RepID=A0AAE0T3C5_9BIVA|nr:hypothetical protein CHS0354_015750 [Potamilus streckersoni]
MSSSLWARSLQNFPHGPLTFLNRREHFQEGNRAEYLLRERLALTETLYSKNLKGHFGCVNAVEFSNGNGEILASGGDDRRVLLWNVEKAISNIGKPAVLKGEHNSNIFCLAFDNQNKTIFSGGNDKQVISHDIETGQTKDVFFHEDSVYGLSTDPVNSNVFASACDDGRILIYDTRLSDPFCLANYTSSMQSVIYNPMEPRLLATANAKEGVGLWDIRRPRSCLLRYGGSFVQQSCMSVRINQSGDQIIALRRRLPPVLYKINSPFTVCEFDHSGYYNSCTMKSCCFAGDRDQYILSGSDEFNLYMWRIPDDLSERLYIQSAHLVLKGHRSIVNQVRFNPQNHLIVSSGVEKIVKVWTLFNQESENVDTREVQQENERQVYTHEEYINLVLNGGHITTHDYSHESMEEDPRMIAFFDSLVQRELEGRNSDEDYSSNDDDFLVPMGYFSPSDSDTDDASINSASEGDGSFSPFTIAFASIMTTQAIEGNDHFPRLSSTEDRLESSDNENIGMMEGQHSDSHRTHISELVAKKRHELKSIIENRQKRKFQAITVSDTCSSSSSSDEEENSKCTSTNGHESIVNKISTQRQRMLKRLKTMSRILESDTESSDDNNSSSPENVNCCNSDQPSTSTGLVKTAVSDLCDVPKRDQSPEHLGPYLHEKCSSTCSHHGRDIVQGLSKLCDNDSVKDSGNASGDSVCDTVVGTSTGTSESHLSHEDSSNQPSTSTDSHPTWTEFKRFKHKMERARRHYRNHHQNHAKTDSDED